MKPLILGQGLLGTEILRQTGWNSVNYPDFDIQNMMTLNPGDYDIMINCVGYTRTYSEDKETHKRINYWGVQNLVGFCNYHKIKLVHISTDYMYAGCGEDAKETDNIDPVNTYYGHYKALADRFIIDHSLDYLICRGTHKPKPFPFEEAWIDQIGNFDYVDVIAWIITKLIKANAEGVYNVGTEKKSMYELAKRTACVKPVKCPFPEVPKNVTMNLDKLKTIL
jgi:dTDP-4-dehydrorhamnose reductase